MPSFPKPPFSSQKKKKRGSVYPVWLHEEDKTKSTTYINLRVVDAHDAVYSMVHAKVSETHAHWIGTKAFKEKVAHTVAKTASGAVKPKMIVKKLSDKLPKMLMYQMYHKLGMQLAAQTVYREDSYLVIQIQVQHVDSKRILKQAQEGAAKTEAEKAAEAEAEDDDSVATAVLDEWITERKTLLQEEESSPFVTTTEETKVEEAKSWKDLNWREVLVLILGWILTKIMPVTITRHLEEDRLPALIQSKIAANMKGMLDKKLASKKLAAEAAVLSEAQEARYFFAQLHKIRQGNEGGGDDGAS